MTTIKFLKPGDPRLTAPWGDEWVRDNLEIDAIEQLAGDPSAYFIMKFRTAYREETRNFRIIVKHKNFFREHFANYNDALEVINKIKGKPNE